MAESSKTAVFAKQLMGAKNEPGRGSNKKRKRGKKATKTQPKESLESELKRQESSHLVHDEQNIVDNSEMKAADKSEIVAADDESKTAIAPEEGISQGNTAITTEEIAEGDQNIQECMNKDGQGQRDLHTTQELKTDEQQSLEPDQTNNSKKGRLSLRRPKKVKISKSKGSFAEDKRVEDLTGETSAEDPKTVEEKTKEICGEQAGKADEAKFEAGESSADMENKEAFINSPEGIQEKYTAKNNKGMKLKQFASFGWHKRKSDPTGKYTMDETSKEKYDWLGDSPERSERAASTQDCQNAEIEETVSKEPVAADKSESNEPGNEKDKEVENTKKEAGKEKKKGSVLSFKRNKPSLRKPKGKSPKKDEEKSNEISPNATTVAGKEIDDVSVMEGDVQHKGVNFEEKISENKGEESKSIAVEAEDLAAKEKSGSAEEKQDDSPHKEEMRNAGNEDTSATAQEDTTKQVSPKKEKKENILRRSLRKLKSPSTASQGRKKSQGDENTAKAERAAVKAIDKVDKRESPESEESVEEQSVAQNEDEDNSIEYEENSKAVKRKKELTDSIRVLKRQKEDGENLTEIQDKDALGETAVVEEKQDAKTFEAKSRVVNDLENVIKELTEVKERSVDEFNSQVNKEMSPLKNNMDEQDEHEQSEVEISRGTSAREVTQTEGSMKGVHVDEFSEIVDDEAKKANEEAIQGKENKANSDEGNAVTENQQQTRETSETAKTQDLPHQIEDELYDSDLTVVTAYPFTEDDELSESEASETEPSTEDEEILAIAEVHVIPSGTETSRVNVSQVKTNTEPDTEDEEVRAINEGVSSETEGSRVKESRDTRDKGEAETYDQSNELESTLKAEEGATQSEDQRPENSRIMESLQSSRQNPAEEWIMVHHLDMTEEIARHLKIALTPIGSLRRNIACCTIM